MSAADNPDSRSPSGRKDEEEINGEPDIHTNSAADSACTELDSICSSEEKSRALPSESLGSAEAMIPGDVKDTLDLDVRKEDGVIGDARAGDMENEPTDGKETSEAKVECDKIESGVDDYDSMLFEFDRFVYKAGDEAVGHGYEIGDIVWGKVKSHPWWPGQIFNEVLASPSVRKLKREGHVLVAFFGDNSYGWFDPEELAPFAGSFHEKSRQSSSRAFLKAIDEAMYEISRRASLGLACRCRNAFNFWPFSVNGYFTVYAGDYEPGVYTLSQIKRSRDGFRPNEMVSFIKNLALKPLNDDPQAIEFVKNKAVVLACRKALFEEFDDTYAQAFGTTLERPPRPTAPVALDPSRASLSGRLVFAEALDKGQLPTKDQLEDEKIVSKSQDGPVNWKQKKAIAQVSQPLPNDALGSSGTRVDSKMNVRMQLSGGGDIKPSEGSKLLSGSRKKKVKVIGQRAAVARSEQASLGDQGKKRKKEANTQGPSLGKESKKIKKETNNEGPSLAKASKKRKNDTSSQGLVSVPFPPTLTWVKKKRAKVIRNGASSKTLPHWNFAGGGIQKAEQMLHDGPVHGSLPMVESQQDTKTRSPELSLLVTDLRVVAIDPFHGIDSGVSGNMRWVFLKYRSLVFQKSLALSPPSEKEANEVHSTDYTAIKPAYKSSDKPTIKHARPAERRDDLTSGGKKLTRIDQPGISKKKKLDDSKDIYKKPANSEDKDRKKLMNNAKSLPTEKKILQQSAPPQRRDAPPKNVHPKLPKLDPSRCNKPVKVRRRTAMIMKFPKGAALPSGAELAARFARFGQLEYTSTRVYWQTDTCRLVFQHKADAEAALKFASSSENLFGYENVFCHLKDAASDGSEPEMAKARKVDSKPKLPMPIKSCLKKPSSEAIGNGTGNHRTRRVKFVLDGDGGHSVTTQSSYSMDLSSKNVVPSLNPQPVLVAPKLMIPELQPSAKILVDISGELLSLLNSCRDVVNNVTGVLGYVPYHSL